MARGLCKRYQSGRNWVYPLIHADLVLYPGQFIAIMGPSGTGKSTLLHILGCLDRPDKGTYYLGGQNVSTLNDHDLSLLRATRIGFVFQAYNLISQCTLLENVTLPFLYHPCPPENVEKKVLIGTV